MKKVLIIFSFISLIFSNSVKAQTDLENNLNNILNIADTEFAKDYLRGYMQPFVTAFGTAVSGAMYHRAYTKGFPRFDAGISAVYLNLPKESKSFIDPNGNSAPTIFGIKEGPFNQNYNQNMPGGTENDYFTIPQLHINMGLFADFEVTARYLGVNIKEFGDITLMGLGIKYGFGDLIPLFSIDMSVQAMYHSFKIDEWLDSGTFGMNLQISKGLPLLPIDFYGGVGFENTAMIITTSNIPNSTADVGDISIDGENNLRVNLGVSWTMLIVNLHAEYNIGTYNSVGLAAMIVL